MSCGSRAARSTAAPPATPATRPYYDTLPTKARRLGPWSDASQLVFDGLEATWAYRQTLKSGAVVDRLYAVDLNVGKPWLRGALPTFDPADRTVSGLKLGQNFAAWVTTKGTVMAAAEGGFGDPNDADPFDLELIGAGTAGSAGLVPSLYPEGQLLVIGQFQGLSADGQATLRLRRLSDADMENEQCIALPLGGHRPPGRRSAARVGGVWRAAYFPHDAYCG